ncbi:MAG: tetratricopeptide repeat protein [Rhodovarius sp.]|nr:tetratricopeptide repeat protein [Rhodovarius sp.]
MHTDTLRQDAGTSARLLAEGLGLLRGGRSREALRLLEAAARSGPSAAAWRALAEAHLDLQNPAAARAAADEALALSPGCPAALALRARAHARAGDQAAALRDAAEAVYAAPRDRDARVVLGQALMLAGRHDEGIAVLGELWQERPEDVPATLHLAEAFLRAGRAEAARELAALVASRPDLPAPWQRAALRLRAQAALSAGAAEEAAALARSALALTGPDVPLLSTLAHALIRQGDMAGARPHLLAAHRLQPQDGYLAHLAATLAGPEADRPARASDAYVAHLFDGYAPGFEASLFALGYRVPGLMLRLLEELLPGLGQGRRLGDVLDLGCGTGLIGVVLHDLLGGRLKGVDLSAGMLAEARAKGCYSELEQASIDEALARDGTRYAVVIAADVFCYFGDLAPTLSAIAPRLEPDGLCLFSVEAHHGPEPWVLTESARYRHSREGVEAALAAAGLVPIRLREEALRRERGEPVAGFLVAARRGGGSA